jgi:hypothetical protein
MARRRHPPRREVPLEQVQMQQRQAEILESARESGANCIGCVMIALFLPALWIADLYLLTLYWNWFAVPLGAPSATVWHTAGILALRFTYGSALKGFTDAWEWFSKPSEEGTQGASSSASKRDWGRLRFTIVYAVIMRLLCLAAALIIHAQMAK